jgi:hypothetical protein
MSQTPEHLTVNLPVDWTNEDYLTADLTDVELENTHGYNYQSNRINEICETVNDLIDAHVELSTKTSPKVFHWSIGESTEIDATAYSAIVDTTNSLSWVNVDASRQPANFSVPFNADIVANIALDCLAYGEAAGNDNNGMNLKITLNDGCGNVTTKYRSLKVSGTDWLSAPKNKQQVRGTIALNVVFPNQPANTAVSISFAQKRIASDWGHMVGIGGRSVTYTAYPV